MYHRKAFTLIELLVVIAIIAILAVVVVLTLNPAQLLAQSRDANRVSDMATLNTALNLYQTDSGGAGNMGSSTVVYISLPDMTSTCANLGLPTLPAGSIYDCSPSTSTRNTNTTGWIPVNFQNISAGSPFGSLPIDPVNTSSSGLYYTYTTTGSQYQFISLMESQKYKRSVTGPLGSGIDVTGNNVGVAPLGWWGMDEGVGSTTQDMSGNNNQGIWSGTPTGTNGTYYSTGKIGPWSGAFDGTSTLINIPPSPTLNNIAGDVTLAAWVYLTATPQGHQFNLVTPITLGDDIGVGWGAQMYITSSTSSFGVVVSGSLYTANGPALALNTWYYLIGVRSGGSITLYINSIPYSSTAPTGNLRGYGSSRHFEIGNQIPYMVNFPGLIDDVRVYNRALSPAEIQAIYNAGK